MNRPNNTADFFSLATKHLTTRQWNNLPAVARITKHLARKTILRAANFCGDWFRVIIT